MDEHQQTQDAQIALALARASASRYARRLLNLQPWFIDPQNSTGHASPTNSGATALEPIDRFSTLFSRWGTDAPIIVGSTVVVTLMSDGILDGSDSVELYPTAVAGGGFLLDGTLRVVGAGTFAAVTPQNRTTGQRYEATVSSSLPADWWSQFVNMFVHDTTTDAWFWVLEDLGARTATLTRPKLSSITNFYSALSTIGPGDAFIIYDLPAIDLVTYAPNLATYANATFTEFYPCQMQHVATATGDAFPVSATQYGTRSNIVECRMISREPIPVSGGLIVAANCFSGGPLLLTGGKYSAISGVVSVNDEHCIMECGNLVLDGDVYVDDHVFASNAQVTIGTACVYGRDAPPGELRIPNGQADTWAGAGATLVVQPYYYSECALWGSAVVACSPGGDIVYQNSAASTFLNLGGLELDGLTTASSYDGTTWRSGIALTPANLDAAAGAAGFGGCAYGARGSKIRQWL